MDSLSETKWDVLISGTGLQNSLLALALSRSDRKVLHVDKNEYYGDTEAAFSLQEADEWVKKTSGDSPSSTFRNASLWKDDSPDSGKLSFSRAYTLSLSPQIIYSKSKLLAQLVSSKVYRQLEFQAVGNWWMYTGEGDGALRRLPNGREDIFQDKSIDNKSKRGLMKFLKFVIDYENQRDIWDSHADEGMREFLSKNFQLPFDLQSVITALALSLDSPQSTPVKWALPRIARHLTSIGVFGPGFGAVIPKWGGGAEVAQVGCRAGAVGGGIYILGTGVQSSEVLDDADGPQIFVRLSNGESLRTKKMIGGNDKDTETSGIVVSKTIAVVSSPLTSLFESSVEGSPLSAVSVIVIPSESLEIDGAVQPHPIYIMAHSSDTGECPSGQCVFYATVRHTESSKQLLEAAISTFLRIAENGEGTLLYSVYYEQRGMESSNAPEHASSLDLAFNDGILDTVESQWKDIIGIVDVEEPKFMKFDERNAFNEEDENEEY